MPVIKNLMVRAGADFSPITQQARRAQRSMEDMSRGVRTSCDTMSSAVRGLRRAFGALGIASMWTAIFADVGVMIIAVLNATRALYIKDLAKKNEA